MLVAAGPTRTLGSKSGARLLFREAAKPRGSAYGRRLLTVDEQPAFELSFWCGSCGFLFKRLEGANQTVSVEELGETLAEGLNGFDDAVVNTFAALLPRGKYLPLLLQVQPRLVRPLEPGDYFAHEHVATWGVDPFWGLPQYPQTPYYRTFETSVDADAHLFEFLVPMVPPSWNDPERVEQHSVRLKNSTQPTAIAVATLDVCQPALGTGSDYYAHWGLTHFLLDGHHKVEAAAISHSSLQLLSLLSVDASLASAKDVARVPALRERSVATRTGTSET